MTVSSAVSKSGPYAGAGTTGPFTVGFRFLDAAHLRVVVTDANSVDTTLVLNTDYAVSGVGADTGSVTLVSPLVVGSKLTIVRNVPATQEADYVQNDAFPAESHETALDKLTMLVQQLDEESDRSIKVGVADAPLTPLPGPTARANTVIGFDAAGNVVTLPLPSSIGNGDRIPYTLVAGVDFIAGTSTQVALPRAPGAPGNLVVNFDGVPQEFGEWSVSGLIVTFTQAIPSYVTEIWGYIGTTLSVEIPPDGSVTTEKIVDNAVTTTKIPDDAITRPKLVDGIIVDALVDPAAGIQATKLSFLQAGTGAIARTVQARMRDHLNVRDFGAVGDGVTDDSTAIQNTINALDNAGVGEIYFPPGTYRTTFQLSVTNKKVLLRGAGRQVTTIKCEMATGVCLSIDNQDCLQYVTIEGITFTTNQNDAVTGLYVKFSEADATNNRIQDRLTLRDLQFFGSAFGVFGHARGIVLENVHAAILADINIAGRVYADGMTAGVDIVSVGTGAPSDITFRNVKVYYSNIGFKGTGHLEGINFSQCFAIAVGVGWDFRLSAVYPWFTMSQCHANVTSQGVHLENFAQSFISNNLIYIVDNGPTSTPVGVSLLACDDTIVVDNNVVNPTPAGAGATVVGYLSQNCQRVKFANNKVAGYDVGYWIDGTSDFNRTFDNEASTAYGGAIGYNMTASGGSNTVRNTP